MRSVVEKPYAHVVEDDPPTDDQAHTTHETDPEPAGTTTSSTDTQFVWLTPDGIAQYQTVLADRMTQPMQMDPGDEVQSVDPATIPPVPPCSPDARPDHEIVREIKTFVGCLWHPEDIVEVRCISQAKGSRTSIPYWFQADDLHNQINELASRNRGLSIFIGLNPRPAMGVKSDRSIRIARSLYIDLDHMTIGEALALLAAKGLPPPSMIVISGHGVHVYWLLATPMTDLSIWSAHQYWLAAYTGGDEKVINPERLTRLPGFWNMREAPFVKCEIYSSDPTLKYDAAAIADITGRPAVPEPEPATYNYTSNESDDLLPVDEHTTHRASCYLYAIPGAVENEGGDHATFKAACHMRDFGLSKDQAFEVMKLWNKNYCKPPWSDAELRCKIDNAYKYSKRKPGNKLDDEVVNKTSGTTTQGSVNDGPGNGSAATEAQAAPEPAGTAQQTQEAPKPQPAAQGPVDKPRFTFLRPRHLKNRPPVEFLIEKWLTLRGTSCMWGASGSGKSFLAVDWACHIVCGMSWMDLPVHEKAHRKILYIVSEGGGSGIAGRLKAWQIEHNKTPEDMEGFIILETTVNFMSKTETQMLIDSLKAETGGQPIDLVIIDTLHRAITAGGGDDSNNADLGVVINNVDGVRAAVECGALYVHHCGHDPSRERGGTALKCAVDTMMWLRREENSDDLTLTCKKQKDGPEPVIGLKMKTIGIDPNNEEAKSCVIVPGNPVTTKEGNLDRFLREILLDAADCCEQNKGFVARTELIKVRESKDKNFKESTFNDKITTLEKMGLIERKKVGKPIHFSLTKPGWDKVGQLRGYDDADFTPYGDGDVSL